MNIQTAIKKFANTTDLEHNPINVPMFERGGKVFISSEHDESMYFLDYYGGYPWICPQLQKAAKQAGGYWEWENPAAIVFCK